MSNWDAQHYLRYDDERSRAADDLIARIKLAAPKTITDLGCGPGNSTKLLRGRWPDARIVGVDNSAEMLEKAKTQWPDEPWSLEDIGSWQPESPQELVFSNAAIQWLGDHRTLLRRLASFVAPHGAIAFQIPSSTYATIRTLIHDVSRDPRWTNRMVGAREILTMEPPEFYYDVFADLGWRIDLWETEYCHVLESPAAVIDWISSTGLRPFLDAIESDNERDEFMGRLQQLAVDAYPRRVDGRVLFPFRRTFLVAYQ